VKWQLNPVDLQAKPAEFQKVKKALDIYSLQECEAAVKKRMSEVEGGVQRNIHHQGNPVLHVSYLAGGVSWAREHPEDVPEPHRILLRRG
jgi:hypothetical protein